MRRYKNFPNSYEKLYGRYISRAVIGWRDVWEMVIVSIVILTITQNVFYFLLYCGYARIKFILSNTKNRQFEILNRIDELERLMLNKETNKDENEQ